MPTLDLSIIHCTAEINDSTLSACGLESILERDLLYHGLRFTYT